MPGRSGTPMTVIFASSRLKAIPEMTASSIFASSSNVISVPSPCSWKLESTRNRSGVRAAAAERGDIALGIDALKTGDDDKPPFGKICTHALLVDLANARFGVRAVGENSDLSRGVA